MTIEHDPLAKEYLVHVNQHYQVVFIPEGSRSECKDPDGSILEGNYEVRSRKWDTVEYRGANLPACLSVAEHFNDILVTKQWETGYEPDQDMFVDLTTDTKGTVQ